MESFEHTFGGKAQRKRPKVAESDMEVWFDLLLFKHLLFDICDRNWYVVGRRAPNLDEAKKRIIYQVAVMYEICAV